jgi:hypothetical protein
MHKKQPDMTYNFRFPIPDFTRFRGMVFLDAQEEGHRKAVIICKTATAIFPSALTTVRLCGPGPNNDKVMAK